VCARLKRPPDSSLLGYDEKKDTPMPIFSPRLTYVAMRNKRSSFSKS
jgi:hypothetical protein